MSNIAEGFDRGTKTELVNFFFIAKGSCGEVKSQLYIAYDIGYIDISKFQHGIGLGDECSRLIQSFVFLKSNPVPKAACSIKKRRDSVMKNG